MGLAQSCDLHELGDAAGVGQGDPRIVDQPFLDQFVDVPAVAELLADGDGHLHLGAQLPVDTRVLAADQVFDEVGFQVLDESGEPDGIGHVQPRVVVDGPIAAGSHAFAHFDTELVGVANGLAWVELIARTPGAGSVGPETGVHAGARRVARVLVAGKTGRVALDVVPYGTSEQVVDRDPESFAPDVPERQIQGTQSMDLFPPGG